MTSPRTVEWSSLQIELSSWLVSSRDNKLPKAVRASYSTYSSTTARWRKFGTFEGLKKASCVDLLAYTIASLSRVGSGAV